MTPPKKPDAKKPRWSRAQKLEAQRAPLRRADGPSSRSSDGPRSSDRRQGGPGGVRSYGNRDSRPSYNRDDRPSYNRDNRDSRPNRDSRGGGERPAYNRDSRDDRGGERRSFGNRDDRPSYNRDNRDSRPNRDSRGGGERPAYNRDSRDDRPSYNRDNRDSRPNRDSRGGGERPAYNRDNRDSRGGERPASNRDNRDSRGGERPASNRDSRGGERPASNRDNRDSRGGERPASNRDNRDSRGERRSFGNRDDRPSYNRDNRDGRTYPRNDRPRETDRAPRRGVAEQVTREQVTPEQVVPEQIASEQAVTEQVTAEQTAPTGDEVNGFAELNLPDTLVRRMARDGITTPFPIQAATIPDALAGRDVLGRGRTGSGKTLAFGLPTLTRLAQGGKARPQCPRALVIVPTRELAMQVSDALQPLVHAIGLHHKLVAGGMPYEPQLQALARGVDLLIATPGRLMDLIDRGAADLSRVEIAVLDEADHMAEMGFLEDITKILDDVPAGGQRLLFSATLDRGIDKVVDRYLIDPVTHSTDDATVSISTMAHHALLIEPRDKKVVTAEVANREGRTVVFSRTKLGADRIASELREQGVLAAALHGGLNQGQRNKVLSAFKDGRIPVLVATDVAARGIHVDDVGVVLQVDPPADHKDYLHRAGRTARAGEKGTVVTLALPHQRKAVARLLEQAGVEGGLQRAQPGDEVIRAAGGRTPEGRSISDQDLHRILTPRREAGRGGGGGRGGRPNNYRGGPAGGGRRSDGPYRGRPRD